jgi:hypothetical protein
VHVLDLKRAKEFGGKKCNKNFKERDGLIGDQPPFKGNRTPLHSWRGGQPTPKGFWR